MTAQELYNEAYQEWEDNWDFDYMLKRYAEDYIDANRLDDMHVFPASDIRDFYDDVEEAFEAGREIGAAPYFRFNGYGNPEPVFNRLKFYSDYIYEEEFKRWCIDNNYYDKEPMLEDFEDDEEEY